jgi:DNA-binding NarL/FixJ family response regulator
MRAAIKATVKLHPPWEVCGEATDGNEAVEKAAELRPDLIVLDFKMPVANGIKAGSEISSATPDVPILMYTLHKTRELEVAAKLVGIRQVIAKEDGAQNLLSAIEDELVAKKYQRKPKHEQRISRLPGSATQSR